MQWVALCFVRSPSRLGTCVAGRETPREYRRGGRQGNREGERGPLVVESGGGVGKSRVTTALLRTMSSRRRPFRFFSRFVVLQTPTHFPQPPVLLLSLSLALSLSLPLSSSSRRPPSSRLKQREYARFVSPFPSPPATLFVVAQVRDLSCAQGHCAHVRSKAERNRRGASNIRLAALRSFHLTSPRSLANLASASLRLPRTPATSQTLSCTEVARGIREAGRSLCANGLFLSLHSLECSLCFPSLFLPSTSVSGLDSSPASNSPPPPPR
jgi:hypothetical protein